jgi:hypothetical protein
MWRHIEGDNQGPLNRLDEYFERVKP